MIGHDLFKVNLPLPTPTKPKIMCKTQEMNRNISPCHQTKSRNKSAIFILPRIV